MSICLICLSLYFLIIFLLLKESNSTRGIFNSPEKITSACCICYRYFLLCVNYFFYGETVADYFATFVQRREQLQFLIRYHRFISFTLYLTGEFLVNHSQVHQWLMYSDSVVLSTFLHICLHFKSSFYFL